MKITYNRLWKLLIDKHLKKVDLQRLTGVSSATITRLSKDQTVNTRVLTRICEVLDCDTSDIMSISKESPNKAKQRSFK